MTWAWGVLAAAALLWPDRAAGPLDGVPLDRAGEALAIALVFPALWLLHPRFLRTRPARVAIIAVAAWKVLSTIALGQQGWCVRFEPSRPYVAGQTGAPHAWDLRADWRAPDPACSAIMTRSYGSFAEFPAWFFNLPPDNESWPGPLDRPPGATVRMRVRGYLNASEPGRLHVERGDDMRMTVSIDGGPDTPDATVTAGIHQIAIDATLTGEAWRLVPTWNGRDPWTHATVRRPSVLDRIAGPYSGFVPAVLIVLLLTTWTIAAVSQIRDPLVLAASAGLSTAMSALVLTDRIHGARWLIASLAFTALLPCRTGLRNRQGVLLLVGVPWLAFVAACAMPAAGHFVLYDVGHDYWMFQRFAYRIVMQAHWLEGGSSTFWFQPFYRWIAGLLHTVFGDSSAGEWLWDGACLLAGSLFSYHIVRGRTGYRWAVVAAALPLGVFALGTPQYLIGRGLGEISSMGFLSAAGIFAMRSRLGALRFAAAAGVLMVLAFYTRLNNLPMAAGIAALTLHTRARVRTRWKPAAIILGIVAAGLLLFAWRNWYYTGVFSMFYGTQKDLLATWQPGMPLTTAIGRMMESVMMVLTVNDPPRFDVFALPVLAGAVVALLAAVRLPVFRRVGLPACAFFFSAIAGAMVARGSAYSGRFSMHVLPITCALAATGAALVTARFTGATRTSAARARATTSSAHSSAPKPRP